VTENSKEKIDVAVLHLNLKGEYFDQIKSGAKLHEYRLASKWLKRLDDKAFDRIFVKRGYSKAGDMERIIERPWRGYELQTIKHPHFGDEPVQVCAIRVN